MSIESNLSDTLGMTQPKVEVTPMTTDDREERTITPDITPRVR